MKTRFVLYLMVIVGLVASVGAIPVFADEVDMWVHRARLTYTGRSSGGPDQMVAYIHIRDATLDMVEGATVSATWTLPDGTVLEAGPAVTNVRGIAQFGIFAGAGDYTICVTDVTKADWAYDESLNRETCAIYWLPPYPYPYPFPTMP
jgi:hypothetical protein